jgi:ribosomal protein S18 acetylase RimI-like enzyme
VAVVDPTGADLPDIAQFIAARNGDETQHIGYLGEAAEDVGGTLAELYPEAVFAVARDNGGDLVGVLGTDWDLAVGRAWLYGPYGEGSDGLYAALTERIPAGVEHELYCASANRMVIEFAERHGFAHSGRSLMYELGRDVAETLPPAPGPVTAVPLAPEYVDQFAAAYEEIFPAAPYKAQAVATRTPLPLVVIEDGRLLGFVTLRLTPEFGNGELAHIGVVADARGRGVGRELLRAAIREAFHDPRLLTLCLNTNVTNDVGRSLYESVGFRRGWDMVAFRRATPPMTP